MIRVTLPWPPQATSANGSQGKWRAKSTAAREYKAACAWTIRAAKALHDALLPGWRVEVFNLDGEVVLRRNRPIDRAYGDAMNSGEVARAWLLAILKAYRAQDGKGGGE